MDQEKIVEITTIEELIEMSTMAGGAVESLACRDRRGAVACARRHTWPFIQLATTVTAVTSVTKENVAKAAVAEAAVVEAIVAEAAVAEAAVARASVA